MKPNIQNLGLDDYYDGSGNAYLLSNALRNPGDYNTDEEEQAARQHNKALLAKVNIACDMQDEAMQLLKAFVERAVQLNGVDTGPAGAATRLLAKAEGK